MICMSKTLCEDTDVRYHIYDHTAYLSLPGYGGICGFPNLEHLSEVSGTPS